MQKKWDFQQAFTITIINSPLKWGVNLIDMTLVGAELRPTLGTINTQSSDVW